MQKHNVILILHDIRSAHNVGAIFRTADAVGVAKIYLTGITPSPLDRFGKPRKDIAKAALGAEKTVPWEVKKSGLSLVRTLRKGDNQIIAIEQATNSTDYKKCKPSTNAVFVLGNEVSGLPKSMLNEADVVAEIPMRGTKESLNVSVAAGIALFRILGR